MESPSIAGQPHNEEILDALIKMEVACRLGLESLPKLPKETEQALRDPIEKLCRLTEAELKRLEPGFGRRKGEAC